MCSISQLDMAKIMMSRLFTIGLIAFAMVGCAGLKPIEIYGLATAKAPPTPYQRIYVLTHFPENIEWLAQPLADGLNKALRGGGN